MIFIIMNQEINHLIAKHGILKSFSIARKVSKKDIKKFTHPDTTDSDRD